MTWTDTAYEFVAQKWAQGRSASEISRGLKATLHMDKTRNAVIGVIHRRNLPKRVLQNPTGIEQSARATRNRRKRAARIVFVPNTVLRPLRKEALSAELDAIRSLPPLIGDIGDLRSNSCRFPGGHPNEPSFGYCGRATCDGQSWCSQHRKLVYENGGKSRKKADATARVLKWLDGRKSGGVSL